MIDTQLLNDALTTLAFVVGLAILLSASIVVMAALAHRRERATGVRTIERYLAAVAERQEREETRRW